MTWLAIYAGVVSVLAIGLVGVILFQMIAGWLASSDPYDGKSFVRGGADDDEEQPERCEGCGVVATGHDREGIPLCEECGEAATVRCSKCNEPAFHDCEGVAYCKACFDANVAPRGEYVESIALTPVHIDVSNWSPSTQVQAINILRSGDGSALTLMCPNPDGSGPDNEAVDVAAEWTDWSTRRFRGSTLNEALMAALKARHVRWVADISRGGKTFVPTRASESKEPNP